jgi:hypothetical protein
MRLVRRSHRMLIGTRSHRRRFASLEKSKAYFRIDSMHLTDTAIHLL